MPKPGYKTTEFAIAVLTALASLVAALSGNLSPKYAAIASAVSAAGYAIARGLAKISPPPVVPPAPPTTLPPTK